MTNPSYVLITPARNEEAYIEMTIRSVISQTVLPEKWVIVSDGSTDGTDDIVLKYAATNSFIRLVQVNETTGRNFNSKVNAFKAGYDVIKGMKYECLGNLDADVSFDPTYFEHISALFMSNRKLGIAGGIIQERIDNKYVVQNISLNSVAGAVQLFRKECFEEIGGYIPMEYGGIDAAAEIMARMHGWEVKTYPQYKVLHHRRVTTGRRNIVATRFYQGITNYLLGYSSVFQITRSFYRIMQRPLLIGSLASVLGYYYAMIRRKERRLPDKAIQFLRNEQLNRLRSYITRGSKI